MKRSISLFLNLFIDSLRPLSLPSLWADILIFIPRFVCGMLLSIDFGASKFGMPWTESDRDLQLFEVAGWFATDIAAYGFPFELAPVLFAWLGAASEAIGGLFLAAGLGSRITSVFIGITMLVAIFCQQWDNGTWSMLPALGFLWVSFYTFVIGPGKLSLDHYISNRWKG